jgi:hypothetical protein
MADVILAENGTRTVVLNRAVVAPNGTGSWAPGERAGFDPEVAASLIARGHARGLNDAENRAAQELRERRDRAEYEELHAQGERIPARLLAKFGPPADKMIRAEQTQRK